MPGDLIDLAYLYVGSADVDADLAFYRDGLGAELVWRFHAFEADVAAVRLGDGPLFLLADHMPAPSILPIWSVSDIDAVEANLRAAGFTADGTRVEVPDGPCLVLVDPSENHVGLLHRARPDAMPNSYNQDNPNAVRD